MSIKEQRTINPEIRLPEKEQSPPAPDTELTADKLREYARNTTEQIRQRGKLATGEGTKLLAKCLDHLGASPDDVTPADEVNLGAIQHKIKEVTTQATIEIEEIIGKETKQDKKKNAESILEQSMEGREINTERAERAKEMSKMLDQYVEARMEDYFQEALHKQESKSGELTQTEKESLLESVGARVERARDFFVSIDVGKRENTPLERIAQAYEFLSRPDNVEQQETFDAAMRAHMQEIVERAFDQHIDNPEQYVSHGFDHSLNHYGLEVHRINFE